MAVFFPHIPQSLQVFHQLFMGHTFPSQLFQHLLDVLRASRALNGLGSPPLLLLGDVILKDSKQHHQQERRCGARSLTPDTLFPVLDTSSESLLSLIAAFVLSQPHKRIKIKLVILGTPFLTLNPPSFPPWVFHDISNYGS